MIAKLKWIWAFDYRPLEFFVGLSALLRGLLWLIYPDMSSPAYDGMGFNGYFWGGLFTATGAFQIAGLWINGAWRKSPVLREVCLIVSGAIYIALVIGFISASSGSTASLQSIIGEMLLVVSIAWCLINKASKEARA